MEKEYKNILNDKTSCQIKVGDMVVKMKYANNRKMKECILDILKRKSKIS